MAGFTCIHVAEETFHVDTSGHVPFEVFCDSRSSFDLVCFLKYVTRFEHHKAKNTTLAIIIHKTLSVTKLSLDVYLVPLHIQVQLRNLSQQ